MNEKKLLPEGDRFVRIREVCARLAVSRSTVHRMIVARKFPRSMRIGSCAVWLESDLDKWIAEFLKANK